MRRQRSRAPIGSISASVYRPLAGSRLITAQSDGAPRVRKAQLAILPTPEGRTSERRVVNLAASLREPGASLVDIEVVNLSTGGFAAVSDRRFEIGSRVWLKLPGIEATHCHVVWVEEGKAGFEFVTPLHPATLDLALAIGRRPPPRRMPGQTLFSAPPRRR